MTSPLIAQSIAATTASASLMLVGNAITQSWMTIPTLIASFPSPGTSEHSTRCALLAQQWTMMHAVGNSFFRPISTLAILGYGFSAYSAYTGVLRGADWRLFALAALCHVANVVHSAVNLQPINARLDAMGTVEDKADAKALAERWINCNKWRVVFPGVAGSLALWQGFLLM